MPGKLLLLAAVLLFGLGVVIEAMTPTGQNQPEPAAATIEPQVLHRHVDVRAMPEQHIDNLF
ncbi:MAG: hypothetical protein ACRD4I_17595 [Candidatus Angelobacter sp.]